MIKGSTGRFLTLILAPLFVIGVTALVLLPRGGSDKVKVDADGPVVRIESPRSRSTFGLGPVTVAAALDDPDGLATAELRVDGKRVARSNLSGGAEETVEFTWTPERGGEYELSVRARDLNGAWGAADDITLEIDIDEVALPPPPTTGTTVAGTEAPTSPASAETTPVPPLLVPPEDPASAASTLLPPLMPVRTTVVRAAPRPTSPPPPVTPGTPGTPGTPATPAPTPAPTLPPTLPPTPPPTTQPPCIVPQPSISQPANGDIEVSRTPLVTWVLDAPCPPTAQELQVLGANQDIYGRPTSPVRLQVALSPTARSYQLTRVLPPCTAIQVKVLAYDEVDIRISTTKSFVTTLADCPPLPTTTTVLPSTDPTTTVLPSTDPTTTVPTPTDPATTTTLLPIPIPFP